MFPPATRVRCAYALALLALATADRADADAGKRAEISPMPFVLGSRYGRSQPRLIAPRNDRFFMGSRYGKRSEAPTAARALLCEPTAAAAAPYSLYRCAAALTAPVAGPYSLCRCAPAPTPARNYHYNNRRPGEENEMGDED